MAVAWARFGAITERCARKLLVGTISIAFALQPVANAWAQNAPAAADAVAAVPTPAPLAPAADHRPAVIPGAPGSDKRFGPLTPATPDASLPLQVFPRPERTSPSSWARPAENVGGNLTGKSETTDPAAAQSSPGSTTSPTLEQGQQPSSATPPGGGTTMSMTGGDGDPFAGVIQNEGDVRQPELGFSGSYTTSVAIDVPAFRGLEPRLRLTYDSNRSLAHGNLRAGQVGVGWSLEGMPDIVRSSPIRGTPDFADTNDVTNRFTFEGEQLEPCVAGMQAASCLAGGTHTTRVESFQKIKKIVGATITWEVTARDGTKFTFKPASVVGGTSALETNYRWLLAEARDTSSQTVTYTYSCVAGTPVCHPSQIVYGGSVINFTFDTKPDVLKVATGASVASLDKRLRLIEVRNANLPLRVYALVYERARQPACRDSRASRSTARMPSSPA